jgi:hypothetical protein
MGYYPRIDKLGSAYPENMINVGFRPIEGIFRYEPAYRENQCPLMPTVKINQTIQC